MTQNNCIYLNIRLEFFLIICKVGDHLITVHIVNSVLCFFLKVADCSGESSYTGVLISP